MKNLKKLALLAVVALGAAFPAFADDCDIDIAVANITKGEIVPEAVNSRLQAKLSQAMSKAGLTAVDYDSRFFVAGRFDDAMNDITGGPSAKVLVKTTLTVYIGDADEKKVFASESFDLKGVGANDTQAYTNAIGNITGSNSKLVQFLREGKQKIVDYYDANYMRYINDAKKEMAGRNYGAALYYATAIPSCCAGYSQASALALQIYNQSMNYDSQQLLAKARAAWAADPTATGAQKAHSFLSQIDPAASCASEAKSFGEEIARTTQKQWEFENVTKYKDALELEKKRIDANADLERRRLKAARDVAVAYASSRPRVVNRYYFIR